MMSLRYLERTTGLAVTINRHERGWRITAENSEDGRQLEAVSPDLRDAIRSIQRMNWEWIRQYVARKQQHRCNRCRRLLPLQFHHIVPRSKGRLDAPSNIEGLCAACHAEQHGARIRH